MNNGQHIFLGCLIYHLPRLQRHNKPRVPDDVEKQIAEPIKAVAGRARLKGSLRVA